MRRKFRCLALMAVAAFIFASCHKSDKEKLYMTGTLNSGIPKYMVCGSTGIGMTGGVTNPTSGVRYYWTKSYNTADTVWRQSGQEFSFTIPDSIGTYTITQTAISDGYYNNVESSTVISIKPWLGGSVVGLPEPKDSILDARDNQYYHIVEAGSLQWFAENLNYYGAGSAYASSDDMGYITGRLYTWKEATSGTSGSGLGGGPKGICPDGWSVPTNEDWEDLAKALSGEDHPFQSIWKGVGNHVMNKATFNSGRFWPYSINAEPANTIGWNALSGGMSQHQHNNYQGFLSYAYFWSSTQKDAQNAYYRYLYFDLPDFPFNYAEKESPGFSVRCVRKK